MPAVVSGVICALLVGLLCGAGAGAAVMRVCIKWRRSKKETGPSPTQTPSPAPLYDDIELVATTKQVEPPLQHNVAYVHVNRWLHYILWTCCICCLLLLFLNYFYI